jgi:hypothetical protein
MNIYLPFKPTKGEAFRLYGGQIQTASNGLLLQTGTPQSLHISKDGGSMTAPTNTIQSTFEASPVYNGAWYIDLTATEMNADVVQVCINPRNISTWGTPQIITIYTDDGGGLSLNSIITDISTSDDISKTNPTLREVLAFLWAVMRKPGQKRRWVDLEKFIR